MQFPVGAGINRIESVIGITRCFVFRVICNNRAERALASRKDYSAESIATSRRRAGARIRARIHARVRAGSRGAIFAFDAEGRGTYVRRVAGKKGRGEAAGPSDAASSSVLYVLVTWSSPPGGVRYASPSIVSQIRGFLYRGHRKARQIRSSRNKGVTARRGVDSMFH